MTVEQRLHPRATVRVSAQILAEGAGDWERVLLHDISAGGAAVLAAAALPIQSEVQIRFRLPEAGGEGGRDLEVASMVVRTGEPARPEAGLPVLVGLHFLALVGEDHEHVRRWVWNHVHGRSG